MNAYMFISRIIQAKGIVILVLLLIIAMQVDLSFLVSSALAADSFIVDDRPEEIGQCSGLLYKAKKAEVPVFQEADKTSQVIARLSAGEIVCYVGEQNEFAVLHWRYRKDKAMDSESQLAYARLVDLWSTEEYQFKGAAAAPARRSRGFLGTLKSYYYYIRSGGVPEDGLVPYRPIIDSFSVKPTPKPKESKGR